MAAVLALMAVTVFMPHAALAERRVALVIGNDDYATLPDLLNAAKDARAMAARLESLGFETEVSIDASRRDMARSLARFEQMLARADVGVMFYAGHGIQYSGRNYLIPTDAQLETTADLRFGGGIDVTDFVQSMQRMGSPVNIVILDACRDNPLPERGRSAARGLAATQTAAQGTAILYSAAPGQAALDGPPGGHGVFTGELLSVLDQPGLTVEEVFRQTAARVARKTGKEQNPWMSSSITGAFVFVQPEVRIDRADVRVEGVADREALFWRSVEDLGTGAAFRAYLTRYPEGAFADLARLRIAMLGDGEAGDDAVAGPVAPQEDAPQENAPREDGPKDIAAVPAELSAQARPSPDLAEQEDSAAPESHPVEANEEPDAVAALPPDTETPEPPEFFLRTIYLAASAILLGCLARKDDRPEKPEYTAPRSLGLFSLPPLLPPRHRHPIQQPCQRDVRPLGAVQDGLHDVRRQQRQAQGAGQGGRRDAFLAGQIADRATSPCVCPIPIGEVS